MNMADDDVSFEAAPDPDKDVKKNLWQKLADVQLAVGYIQQRGEYKIADRTAFKYLQNIDIRRELRVELASRNITLKCGCAGSKQRDVLMKTAKGERTVIHTELNLTFEFINGDDPSEREPCDWMGWGEGANAYNAYGGMTGGQRHFLSSFFLILSGAIDPEQWSADAEEELSKQRAEGNKRAMSSVPGKKVGGEGHFPTKAELLDSDESRNPPEPVPDESWRGIKLLMCKGLTDRYPGKTVSDIHLKHLIQAQSFVKNVHDRVEDHVSPGHHQLANALLGRMLWEISHGNVTDVVELDGTHTYEIVKKS